MYDLLRRIMEELLYIAGGIALLIMGFFKMKTKVDGAKAEASMAKTSAEADQLNKKFEELNKQADALRNKDVKVEIKEADAFWKDKLQ
jgi:hypothetical protein